MDTQTRLSVAREAAVTGAEVAMGGFRGEFTVESKASALDSVTEFDREVQRRIATLLREEKPDAVIVGEETLPNIDTRTTVPEEGDAWVVDPIDGTNNFVGGNRNWGVAVAAVDDGEPVAAVNEFPAIGDTYVAAAGGTRRSGESCSVSDRTAPEEFTINPIFGLSPRHRRMLSEYVGIVAEEFGDHRRFGCAQLALSAVAAGELEAAVSAVPLHPWDLVGGAHLVRQAGGTVTDIHGDRWTPHAVGLIASNGAAHDRLVDAFDAAD
ncbi:MAG: inositol monophosphatase [Halolamina sp.]|uniref:inositol monophosphatase family protein n=1 Tax=Halolamina sp. TaxID=1940283 RepID=UPI002FC399DA